MQRKVFMLFVLFLFLIVGLNVEASSKPLRFSEISSSDLEKIMSGKPSDLIVEFREGDQIPVSVNAIGEIFETVEAEPRAINVKRTFFLNFEQMPTLLISWDGEKFVPFQELVTGTVDVGFQKTPESPRANGVVIGLTVLEKRK